MADDKQWASKYLLDPLTAPEPSDETGPGTHHVATRPPRSAESDSIDGAGGRYHPSQLDLNQASSSSMPRRGNSARVPPTYQSSKNTNNPFRDDMRPQRRSAELQNGARPGGSQPTGRRRGSSLNERYPGDQSTHPLNMIRKDTKAANRSPHLRRKHMPGKDSIDGLDNIGSAYHHDGPYDAALLARNTSYESSPIEALRDSNNEAIKATPSHYIKDTLSKHRPLDGTAQLPPGSRDELGQTINYENGPDMMIEHGGNFKRWPGVTYQPEDLKGVGEPSYSINKALKEHNLNDHRRMMNDGESGYEMTPQSAPRSRSHGNSPVGKTSGAHVAENEMDGDLADDIHQAGSSSSPKGGALGGLKKRIGSLKRSKDRA
ncbi:MAG: hypothetical protein M4579_006509 [Chaenotheca gracillima]|nr:MAG: hypothetical protein M4579_006509 [Chaenotheca gracillima]